MRSVNRYHHRIKPKPNKLKLLVFISMLFVLVIVFVPGHNGLIKILTKSYKIHKLYNENERLKIKAELIESKIAKAQNPEFLKKYMRDNYQIVLKDSSK
jgi:cell division protein FtsB